MRTRRVAGADGAPGPRGYPSSDARSVGLRIEPTGMNRLEVARTRPDLVGDRNNWEPELKSDGDRVEGTSRGSPRLETGDPLRILDGIHGGKFEDVNGTGRSVRVVCLYGTSRSVPLCGPP